MLFRSLQSMKVPTNLVIPSTELTWKSRAPSQCKFFAWLALRNRCWTSDRLARRGLPHQDKCPLCDQEEETIDHVLLTCGFDRTIWMVVCRALGKPEWTPSAQDALMPWLCGKQAAGTMARKDLHTILLLTLWELWKHRNAVVFDGASPSTGSLMQKIEAEGRIWSMTGLMKGNMDFVFAGLARWISGEEYSGGTKWCGVVYTIVRNHTTCK